MTWQSKASKIFKSHKGKITWQQAVKIYKSEKKKN